MRLRFTPENSADQRRHNNAKIRESSQCTIEESGLGYGKWFEIPSQLSGEMKVRIYVVLGWSDEASILEHPALAAQRGYDCLQVPAGGFVFQDSTGFYVYGSSGAYGSGAIDAARIIEGHFRELGILKRVMRQRP